MSEIHSTLITPRELAGHLEEEDWVVFDCRHQLTDHEYGFRAYGEAHIPDARYADMEEDLSGSKTPASGRHPLPDWDDFMAWLGKQGVSNATQVVAYDDDHGAFASRLWFMLQLLGHRKAAVLNGGFRRWRDEGHPLETYLPRPRPAVFQGKPNRTLLMPLEEVEGALGRKDVLLVDARGAIRYRGEEEPIDPKGGHIPGAVNLPFPDNVGEDGVFHPPEKLKERLLAGFGGVPPEQVVHYCGSGVSACHNLLAQAVAGLPLGKLYPGSWSQWCADDARPLATGPNP